MARSVVAEVFFLRTTTLLVALFRTVIFLAEVFRIGFFTAMAPN
jgi:hypothetical protein